jgi:hypothetical protein
MEPIQVGRQGKKICAFCKNWYDPCSEGIMPTRAGWKYVPRMKKMCMIKHHDMSAEGLCKEFCSRV